MEYAERVLSFFPVLISVADLYAALARMADVPEVPHLTHLTKELRRWSNLVIGRTGTTDNFALRRLASGLLHTAVSNHIRAAIPPPRPRPTAQDRRWSRRAALFGSIGQRHLGAGMRVLSEEDQSRLIRACDIAHSWAATALVGARSSNVVEHALKQAFLDARTHAASPLEDALEATDFTLTWPHARGGYLIQVKTAPQRDTPVRVLVYHRSVPHRHQFLLEPGDQSHAEEARQIGDRQHREAFRVWTCAQERWQRTQEPWFAAFITVHAELAEPLVRVLPNLLRQSFTPVGQLPPSAT